MFELAQGLRDSKATQSELLEGHSVIQHQIMIQFLSLGHDSSQNLIKICHIITINKIR